MSLVLYIVEEIARDADFRPASLRKIDGISRITAGTILAPQSK